MMNPMNLTGRRILVTGASSGLGRETALCLSQLGAKVVIVGRNHQRLQATAALLEGDGHRVEPFDLQNVDGTPEWLKSLANFTGPMDGLVHSAGVQMTQPVQLWNSKDHDALMTANVSACLSLAKGFRQRGVYGQGASLVFLASIAGIIGAPGISSYCASKGAVMALTRALSLEFVRQGIRVNCVAPGHVETEMAESLQKVLTSEQLAAIAAEHPLGIGRPRDVANAIAFLLADTGRWITGTTLVVDGGCTAR